MIPYGKHSIDRRDIDAVVDVLQNQFLTQGQQVPAFERALARYCQTKYAVAVNSGTSALHIACLALQLGPGDELWTSPISFVASSNCALYCGAKVDFVDIDPLTRNLSVEALREKLAQSSVLPKAVVAVHYAGESCDMRELSALAEQYGFALIEDASHALGGTYSGEPIGCGRYSTMTVLSFHPVKSITSAEGGAVLCRDPVLAEKLILHAKHGITRDPELMTETSHGAWYYQQITLGYNYRLSDIHAALGLSQLQRLDEFIARRRALAQHYQVLLADVPVRQLPQPSSESAWHLYTVEVAPDKRKQVFDVLRKRGIGVNVHYIPIHLQPYYQQMGFAVGQFPIAEAFYAGAVTLPLYPELTDAEQEAVAAGLREAVS